MSTGKNKSYKGKTCVYCGVPKISNTGDHVLALQFVLERHRGKMPKVPACDGCNGEKSKLEHHLTAVLPIAARHADAAEFSATMVPKRLDKNSALRRSVEHTAVPRWVPAPSGLLVPTSVVLVDADALLPWSAMVVKGLVWHHWKIIVSDQYEVVPALCHGEEAAVMEYGLARRGEEIPETTIGGGALSYQAQGVPGYLPESIWRLQMYGGVEIGGEDPRLRVNEVYVVVAAKDRAERERAQKHGME